MTQSLKYRADGLRTIAVVPVVLFHASIPGFSGGYVGVDIFFVISGFLITGIITKEVHLGRYSTLEFYKRRIKRIFPALLIVVAMTTLASLLIFPPDRLIEYFTRLRGQSLT